MLIAIPSLISFSRCILGFFLLFLSNCGSACFVSILFLGAFTDFIDGFLARRFSLQTKFGEIFDPISDRVFFVCVFYYMFLNSYISLYEVILFSFRDVVILIHYLASYFCKKIAPPPFKSLKYGKILTSVQFISCLLSGMKITSGVVHVCYFVFLLMFIKELFISG